MLVLAIKTNARAHLIDAATGEEIVITVVDTRGGTARLGFDAPARYKVLRSGAHDADIRQLRRGVSSTERSR